MTSALPICLLAQSDASPDELYDIVVLQPTPGFWGILFGIALAVVLIVAAFLLIYFLVFRKKSDAEALPHLGATRRLQRLDRDKGIVPLNEFSLEVSDTLKDYLAAKFEDRVRYETATEFLQRTSEEESSLPDAAKQEVGTFLRQSEAMKFSGQDTSSDETKLALLHQAVRIVRLCETVSEAAPPTAAK